MPNTSPIRLCVMHGDGIGPEITAATLGVLRAAAGIWQIEFAFDEVEVGLKPLQPQGTTFPESAFEAAKAADGMILGPVSHNDYPPADKGGINPSGALRKRLDLFANIRPAKTRAQISAALRQAGRSRDRAREHRRLLCRPQHVSRRRRDSCRRRTSRSRCARSRVTARRASSRKRFAWRCGGAAHVTAVHKANVLRVSDGLFLECARAVAARYPQVKYEEQIIDAMAALLVRDASAFDVIVTTNMFGDILSDEASEIAGSLGLAESINAGTDHAMAQAQHGSAPDIAGQDKANPSSLIGSAAMLLAWLGERRDDARLAQAAAGIERALDAAIAEPEWRTADLGGPLGTRAFGEKVCEALED